MSRWLRHHPTLRGPYRIALLGLAITLTTACSQQDGEIARLGLHGRLVYSQAEEGLWEVDFESGTISQLWDPPEGGMVFGVAASPDGLDLAIAYAAPNAEAGIPRADLYLANSDGSNLQLMHEHAGLYESFDDPIWSPDGRWLYFTRSDVFISEDQTFSDVIVNVERIAGGGGSPELVISSAEQASISADGKHIAYLQFDLESYTRSLWVADIDGSNAVQLLSDDRFFDIATPRFSPNGQLIAFAASGEFQASADRRSEYRRARRTRSAEQVLWELRPPVRTSATPRWFDWLLGIQTAYAHGLPWDFWTIPTSGGEPTKLTNWATDGAVLSWSPAGEDLAMMHLGGLFVQTDGEPVMLAETPLHGGVDWSIP